MTAHSKKQRASRIPVLLLLIFLVVFMVATTVYHVRYEDMDVNDSLFQDRKEYYGTDDWNNSKHVFLDLDSDGQKDLISLEGCIYLSSFDSDDIPVESRCNTPGYAGVGFPQQRDKVGQIVASQGFSPASGVRKSFLVKTQQDEWKYYNMEGLFLSTYVMNDQMLFKRTNPTFLDWADVLVYQTTHAGISLLFITLFPLIYLVSYLS